METMENHIRLSEGIVSLNLALKLKEKGFNEKTLFVYNLEQTINPSVIINQYRLVLRQDARYLNEAVNAPSLYNVCEWLRQNNIDIVILPDTERFGYKIYIPQIYTCKEYTWVESPEIIRLKLISEKIISEQDYCTTWNKACDAAIRFVLKYILVNPVTHNSQLSTTNCQQS